MTVHKDDQELVSTHLIFGKNIRELCRRVGTIAEVADSLGINRVQMNRILNGESFPKPGLLKRICEYFDVDARILLQPLAELEGTTGQSPSTNAGSIWKYSMFGRNYFVADGQQSDILPDGIHVIYRPSFLRPTSIWIGLLRVFSYQGVRVVRGLEPIAAGMKRSDLTPISSREYRGTMLNSSESVSFLYATRVPNTVLGLDHFSTRTWSTHGFLVGSCMIMSTANPFGNNIVPSVLQPLDQKNAGEIMQAARQSGFCKLDDLPRRYKEYLVP